MIQNEIEKHVLEEITPPLEFRKKIQIAVNEIKEKIQDEIKKRNLQVSVELVGSVAKDTFLKNNMDIDFFLLFSSNCKKEYIAKNAILIGRKILSDAEESYAEHPYIRGYFKDLKVEIVPCYKIEKASQKLSAVDRTPLHTEYIKENLKEEQKQEVRLFKQFLRGIGVYGAEAEIEGFSGYLCELLIIKYGSFAKLIGNAQYWKKGKKIALSKRMHPNFKTPLIFIDPVDENRNVASALSEKNFELFIKACKEYSKEPGITFFFQNKIKPLTIDNLLKKIKKQKCLYVGVEIDKPDIIAENLYPQLRKAKRTIWKTCEKYGFTIYDVVFDIDDFNKNVIIIIKSENKKLSKTVTHAGPPTEIKRNSEEFMNRWKKDPKLVR
ncbi:MAG: CCA tRNA nucleotidyltransferase, partial [Thermoplasmatales archaeon]